jgi:predicted nucleic acid-binding protein
MPNSPLVFDSWAIVAYLQAEPAADEVESLICVAQQTGRPMWITAVNLGEVWYKVARSHSDRKADQAVGTIRELGLRMRNADWDLTREAARLKARYRLSYADCFAAALAKQEGTAVITGDPEFRQLEKEVKIHWL